MATTYRNLNRAQLASETRQQLEWLRKLSNDLRDDMRIANRNDCADGRAFELATRVEELENHIGLMEEIERRLHFGEICEARLIARAQT